MVASWPSSSWKRTNTEQGLTLSRTWTISLSSFWVAALTIQMSKPEGNQSHTGTTQLNPNFSWWKPDLGMLTAWWRSKTHLCCYNCKSRRQHSSSKLLWVLKLKKGLCPERDEKIKEKEIRLQLFKVNRKSHYILATTYYSVYTLVL